jgi:hypothetical protein
MMTNAGWALAATLCLFGFNTPAACQDKPSDAINGTSQTTPAPQEALDNDPRLRQKITFDVPRISLNSVIDTLGHTVGVELTAPPHTDMVFIACCFHQVPLSDVMTSLAETWRCHWVKTSRGGWSLEVPSRTLDLVRPNSEMMAQRYQNGFMFLQQSGSLPPNQQSLLNDANSGLPISALPPEMQTSLTNMYAGSGMEALLNGGTVSLDQGGSPQEGYKTASVRVMGTASGHRMGLRLDFPVFQDPHEDYHIVSDDADSPLARQKKDAQQTALKNDPRFQRIVSLQMEYATFAQALRRLAEMAHLDFVQVNLDENRDQFHAIQLYSRQQLTLSGDSHGIGNQPEVDERPLMKSFTFSHISVKAALARLQALYAYELLGRHSHYDWYQTRGGILVFHSVSDEKPTRVHVTLRPPQ